MPQELSSTWSNNWMSGIKNGTKISEISIPGTHDSCARFEEKSPRKQTQWFSIIQQLNRGIRFLDIRCRYKADDERGRTQGIYFPIHHADAFQHIFFEEVQAQCIAFLSENPAEFILINIQMEYEGDGEAFREKFLALTAPYQAKYWYLKNTISTIDDCRGRMVLIRAYDKHARKGWASGLVPDNPETGKIWPDGMNGGGLEWNGFNHQGESQNAIFKTQNGWHCWDSAQKGHAVEQYIEAAEHHAANGFVTLNFASFVSDSGPGPDAQRMNVRLRKFLKHDRLKGRRGVPLGIIAIDFTGNTGDGDDALENLVIANQRCQVPDTSYSGTAEWLIKTIV